MAAGGLKICTSCYVGRPLKDFRLNKRVLASGVVRLYRTSPCRICRRKRERKQRADMTGVPQKSERVKYRRRKPREVESIGHRVHTEKTHAQHLRWTYGLSLETYNEIYDHQQGRCAICQRKPHQIPSPHRRRLVVDHDHETDRVRGLLCHDCNLALGLFRDRLDLLKAALTYLDR
jgi:hypothetical protein